MKTVLVAGAGGYIGVPLCAKLLEKGHKVLALDRYFFGKDKIAHLTQSPNFEVITEDIRTMDPARLEGAEVIFDLAGLSNDASAEINPRLTVDINHKGAARLAREAKSRGIRRYIYSSSASVYGAGEHRELDETSQLNPLTEYARSKVAMEQELAALGSEEFEVVILRNATVYGMAPRMRFDLVVNIMSMRAWRDRLIYIMGGGKQWRPLVHIRDVVQAMMLAMESPPEKVNGEIFNVGSDRQNYEIEQLSRFVMDIIPNVRVHRVPDLRDRRSYHLKFRKIQEVLGFEATTQVHEGIVEVKQALEQGTVDPTDPTCFTLQWYRSIIEWERRIKELSHRGQVLAEIDP